MNAPRLADSVCIRCGKTRIFKKTWKDRGERQKGSIITYETAVCPDKSCQKLVDEKFQKMRDIRIASENRKKGIIIAKASTPA
ncbi:MAG TPA: hypothetical protein VLE91_05145 [Candidatus Saccharimonadales bacterium]|nr:hypothetical protein [Candidatus Saccharimonadales bacterium]